jgi:hypothetical protein
MRRKRAQHPESLLIEGWRDSRGREPIRHSEVQSVSAPTCWQAVRVRVGAEYGVFLAVLVSLDSQRAGVVGVDGSPTTTFAERRLDLPDYDNYIAPFSAS